MTVNTDWSDIPDVLLRRSDTVALMDWLRVRGLEMSLLDLDTERRRRGFKPKGSY